MVFLPLVVALDQGQQVETAVASFRQLVKQNTQVAKAETKAPLHMRRVVAVERVAHSVLVAMAEMEPLQEPLRAAVAVAQEAHLQQQEAQQHLVLAVMVV
jgi:hypothetical protein